MNLGLRVALAVQVLWGVIDGVDQAGHRSRRGRLMSDFGNLLRRHRATAGLTQQQLAEKAGLSPQAVSALERGVRRAPHGRTVSRLADALLLDGEDRAALDRAARLGARGGGRQAAGMWTAPRELPAAPVHFSGRVEEEAVLTATLSGDGARRGGSPLIAAISGMAGVGKTSLALRVAHTVAERFTDGQIFVQLGGPDGGLSPRDAVDHLLRCTGLRAGDIPASLDAAVAMVRSRLADKRMLIVLDNATGDQQVAPLIPGSAGCAVIITSRQRLVTTPAHRHLQLSVLDESDSLDLIGSIVGADRVAAQRDDAAALAAACGHLPLALKVAASRLASRAGWSLADMVSRLADERRRLDQLEAGTASVRASLAVSVDQLRQSDVETATRTAECFALLGLAEGPDLSTDIAARLVDMPEARTAHLLERLVDLQLLEASTIARYRFHDLVRTYSRELATNQLPAPKRDAAIARLVDLFYSVAWRAGELSDPLSPRTIWRIRDVTDVIRFESSNEAFDWIDREFSSLAAFVKAMATVPGTTADVVGSTMIGLRSYFVARGQPRDWLDLISAVQKVVTDRSMSAALLCDKGLAQAHCGRWEAAETTLRKSTEQFHAIGLRPAEAMSANNTARALLKLGHIPDALKYAQRSLTFYGEAGDVRGQCKSLTLIGQLHCRQGDRQQELKCFSKGLVLSQSTGDPMLVATAMGDLGQAQDEAGMTDKAISNIRESIRLMQESGYRSRAADSLNDLGEILSRTGSYRDALDCHEEALALAEAGSDLRREARALRLLGETHLAAGRWRAGRAQLEEAIRRYDQFDPNTAETIRLRLR